MPRVSVRQEPSAAAPMTQRSSGTEDGRAFAAPLSIWLDLTLLNHTGLNQVLERYTLPMEVTTYFQLRFQSPKVISVNRVCFLVTFVVVPSPRQLFVAHELKLCVTPTLVAGLSDRVSRTLSPIGPILSQPVDLPAGGVARFVWEMLDGVVTSYEVVATTILDHVLVRKGTEDLDVRKQRVAALAELIGQQQVFLRNVAHAGRKVGVNEQHAESAALDTRLERLLRSIDRMSHTAPEMRTHLDPSDDAARSTS